MKVIYKIDKEKDKKKIYSMLKFQDPSGNWNRAKRMGIDEESFKLISESKSYGEVKSVIDEIYEKRYLKDRDNLSIKKEEYEEEWRKLNDRFFSETEKVTGLKWKYEEYIVITSLFHPGISNIHGNEVYLWIYSDTDNHLRIAAHELLMTHIWQYFFTKFSQDEINRNWNKYWSLNEITSSFILGLEEPLNSLWSDRMKGYKNFLLNYPQLLPKRDILVDKYIKKKSFDIFIKESLEKFKKAEEELLSYMKKL